MNISVIGIGYVGAVTSACLCKSGHHVIATDIDKLKVDAINKGVSPIYEKNLDDLISTHVKKGTLSASTDIGLSIEDADVIIICVGTPSHADGSLNLSYVKDVCCAIGTSLKNNNKFQTIVLRSTVLPGSSENICIPLLEEHSQKKEGKDFGFGFNPEFLREGSAIEDYFAPPKIVVGSHDQKTNDIITALYDGIEAPHISTDIKVAEGVKYADNVWHAMKIGFANEMGNILSESGIDSHKVMDIFCQDQKLNISKAYLKPGFAYGGSCLPKDLRAIRSFGKDLSLRTPLFDALESANDNQIERALQKISTLGSKNILLLGLSFKAGTDDLRESPLLTMAQKIIEKNLSLKIFDPYVQINHLKHFTSIQKDLISDYDLTNYDLVIIGNNNPEFLKIAQLAQSKTIKILDLVRLSPTLEKEEGYYGLCW